MIATIVFVSFCILLITQAMAISYANVLRVNNDQSYHDASVRSRGMYHLRAFLFWPILITVAVGIQIKLSGKGGWGYVGYMFFAWIVSCFFSSQMLYKYTAISYWEFFVCTMIASVIWYAIAYLIGFFVWDKTGKLVYDPSF